MLLEHVGEAQSAQRVMQAIEHLTTDASPHTRDLGETSTTEVTHAACARVDVAAPARQ